ncbi:MAG: hypothetical protein Q4B99_03755 [Clostridia bacterium]|nr:hypothetical protein [Clostridia bacterium]
MKKLRRYEPMKRLIAISLVLLLLLCSACAPVHSDEQTPTPDNVQPSDTEAPDERVLLDCECAELQFDAYNAAETAAVNGVVNVAVFDSDDNIQHEFSYTGMHSPEFPAEAYEYNGCCFEFFVNYGAYPYMEKDFRPIANEDDAAYLYDVLTNAAKAGQETADVGFGFEFTVTGAVEAEYLVNSEGEVYIAEGDAYYPTGADMELERLYEIRTRYLCNGYMAEPYHLTGSISLNWLYDGFVTPENYKLCIRHSDGRHIDLTFEEAYALFGDEQSYLIDESTRTYLNVFDAALAGDALQITEHYRENGEVRTNTLFLTADGDLMLFRTFVRAGNCSSDRGSGIRLQDCLITYKSRTNLDYGACMAKLQELADSIG